MRDHSLAADRALVSLVRRFTARPTDVRWVHDLAERLAARLDEVAALRALLGRWQLAVGCHLEVAEEHARAERGEL
jgi:hypothetical protein